MPQSTFAIVNPDPSNPKVGRLGIWIVKQQVFAQPMLRNEAIKQFQTHFGEMPVVLAREKEDGSLEYFGRPNQVKWLSQFKRELIPWKTGEIT